VSSRQLIRPVGHPEKEAHDYVEHERLVSICDACGWPYLDHLTVKAMAMNLQAGLSA
jgi:hypothetical protein